MNKLVDLQMCSSRRKRWGWTSFVGYIAELCRDLSVVRFLLQQRDQLNCRLGKCLRHSHSVKEVGHGVQKI